MEWNEMEWNEIYGMIIPDPGHMEWNEMEWNGME